jgi:hypothetical protein
MKDIKPGSVLWTQQDTDFGGIGSETLLYFTRKAFMLLAMNRTAVEKYDWKIGWTWDIRGAIRADRSINAPAVRIVDRQDLPMFLSFEYGKEFQLLMQNKTGELVKLINSNLRKGDMH